MFSNMLNETNNRLSNLPNEILDHVLSHVPKSDLPKLCLVSKSLRRAAEPFLYSDVTFRWVDNGITPPIVPLLRTLFKRPELFALIDKVALRGPCLDESRRPRLNTTETPVHQFLEVIEQSRVPYSTDWIFDLHSGQMDAIAALLISNLTETTHISIKHNFIGGHDFAGKVLRSKIFGSLPTFSRLKEIRYVKSLDYPVSEENIIFETVLSLFYVPTVTHLVATIPNPKVFRWPRAEPNLDHLVSLDIQWLVEPFLGKILALTRNLKSLSWTWIYCDNKSQGWESAFLNFDRIIETVSHVKGTLETLKFRTAFGINGIIPSRDLEMTVFGSFDGLGDFGQITHLEVPLVCLKGTGPEPIPLEHYLPDGLESLTLFEELIDDEGIKQHWILEDRKEPNSNDILVEMIQSLAATRPMRLPALRLIEIISGNGYIHNSHLEKLVEGLAVGFQVRVKHYPLFNAEYIESFRNSF